MTVKELTEILLKTDPDIEVVVDGYEDGFDPVGRVVHKFIKPYSDPSWYYGKYEESDTGQPALLISRN
jgi:hypothetical protein